MFAASFSLLALVMAALVAGQRYFYCPTMERSAFTACCEGQGAEPEADLPEHSAIGELAECCEARSLEASAPYAPHHSSPQLFAPLVAILPPHFVFPELAIIEPPPASSAEIRAGPSAGEARATLQVYLC